METTVYGEIVQMKQDRIIPRFRCQIIKTIVPILWTLVICTYVGDVKMYQIQGTQIMEA